MDSDEMNPDQGSAATLVALLRERARQQPERRGYGFLSFPSFPVDGEETETHLTWAELDRRARALAATLERLGATGERALLLYPPGPDYVAALFGCPYAGTAA